MTFDHANLVHNFRLFLQARTAQATPLPKRPSVPEKTDLAVRVRDFALRFGLNHEMELRGLAALTGLDPTLLSATIVDPAAKAYNDAWQPTLGAVVIEQPQQWRRTYMLVYREPLDGHWGGDSVSLADGGSGVFHSIGNLTYSGWDYATPAEIDALPDSKILGFYAAFVQYREKLFEDKRWAMALALVDRAILGV